MPEYTYYEKMINQFANKFAMKTGIEFEIADKCWPPGATPVRRQNLCISEKRLQVLGDLLARLGP